MRTIQTTDTTVKVTYQDGKITHLHRSPDEPLAQWYWRSFLFIAMTFGMEDCVVFSPRLLELGIPAPQSP